MKKVKNLAPIIQDLISLRKIKANRFIRIILVISVVLIFTLYFVNNQGEFSRLKELSLIEILLIFTGHSIVITSNTIILILLAKYVNKKVKPLESFKIISYSSIINFFGFMQGGLGFRGVYLKKIHSVPYSKYLLLTLLQYVVFFGGAALMVIWGLIAVHNNVQFIKIIFAAAGVAVILLALGLNLRQRITSLTVFNRITAILEVIRNKKPYLLFFAILLQLSGSMIVYATSLNAIGAQFSIAGLFIYTGVAQFSIIVALTPGALGFREGLLLLAQSQMMLTSGDIILSSTIDRVVYFLVLLLLTPIAVLFSRENRTFISKNMATKKKGLVDDAVL